MVHTKKPSVVVSANSLDSKVEVKMKLKLKNIGVEQPVVRIIRLTGETTLDNSDNQFTVMDEAGMDFGIRLGQSEISCDGSHPFAGLVELDLTGGVAVRDDQGKVHIYENLPSFINGMRMNCGVTATQLTAWEGPNLTLEPIAELDKDETSSAVYLLEGDVTADKVEWSSTDVNVVTIDDAGLVTAIGGGDCYIQVKINGYLKAATKVTVAAPLGPNEFHITTTEGQLTYSGGYDDLFEFSDGTSRRIKISGSIVDFPVPAGKHKVILAEDRNINYSVSFGGEPLLSISHFPTMDKVRSFRFSVPGGSGCTQLVSAPTYLPPNITIIENMFEGCFAFTGDGIENWDVSRVTDMNRAFQYARNFIGDLSKWSTDSLNNIDSIFRQCYKFNSPVNHFKVDKVTNFSAAFSDCSAFNQDLGLWDTSAGIKFSGMFFDAPLFNQDIGSWNVSKGTIFDGMFRNAVDFNQDLSFWCVSGAVNAPNFATGSGMSAINLPVWGKCPVRFATVEIDPVTELQVGRDYNLTYSSEPIFDPISVKWNSSDNEVMSFNEKGTLTVHKLGTVTIELLVDGRWSDSLEVTSTAVVAKPFTGKLKSGEFKLTVDNPEALGVKVNDVEVEPVNNSFIVNATDDQTVEVIFKDSVNPVTTMHFENGLKAVVNWGEYEYNTGATGYVALGPDIENVPAYLPPSLISLQRMFQGSVLFNDPNISLWDTTNVVNMNRTFQNATIFNQQLLGWVTTSVTDMEMAFHGALEFNQNLTVWSTPHFTVEPIDFAYFSKLTPNRLPVWGTVTEKTEDAFVVNYKSVRTITITAEGVIGPLEIEWAAGIVETIVPTGLTITKTLPGVTTSTLKIKGNITGRLGLSAVVNNINTDGFKAVTSFGNTGTNRISLKGSGQLLNVPPILPLTITSCFEMFQACQKMNDPNVSNWNTSRVTDISFMFYQARAFNQILNWDVRKVTTTESLFRLCDTYNKPMVQLSFDSLINAESMFESALVFNQELNDMNVSKVTNMTKMFYTAKKFNKPLNKWKVDNVTLMNGFLRTASIFNQDLSMWCVGKIPSLPTDFNTSGILTPAYFPVWGTCPAG